MTPIKEHASFGGIEVHQDESHATVQDDRGSMMKKGYFENSPSGFRQFFDGIDGVTDRGFLQEMGLSDDRSARVQRGFNVKN